MRTSRSGPEAPVPHRSACTACMAQHIHPCDCDVVMLCRLAMHTSSSFAAASAVTLHMALLSSSSAPTTVLCIDYGREQPCFELGGGRCLPLPCLSRAAAAAPSTGMATLPRALSLST